MSTEATPSPSIPWTRRQILAMGGALAARAMWPRGLEAALPEAQPWGAIEKVADGIWAVASTPLAERDFTTVCNGGIVAGKDRVLVVEAFASSDGASWAAEAAKALTGRAPTDVVVSHYHGDHTGGLAGMAAEGAGPTLHVTPTTLGRVRDSGQLGISSLSEDEPLELDLGGRAVIFRPFSGHTASDVTVEVPQQGVLFGGDLLWNRMLPNFVDARPLELSGTLRALAASKAEVVVPGHGPVGGADIARKNVELAELYEQAGRKSFESGTSPADAAKELELGEFGSWTAFNPAYVERAIGAWHQALSSD